jgi:long-chain acyl-CoA synthetase
VYGLAVTIGGMHAREPRFAVMQRWFDAAGWVRLVEEHRIETSPVVPSMLTLLMAEPLEEHDLSSFATFGCGSAPLPAALRERVQDRMGARIYEGYGCTEASAGVSACRPGANRPGSVGKPLENMQIAILDDSGSPLPAGDNGEICVRGPAIMTGYWKSPEQSAEALAGGWLHTGDIGHLDPDGYLYVVDRKKDLIIRGGFNVFPRDVEDALLTHPEVISAAVVGRPDETHGEEVVALVALAPGSSVSPAELIAYSQTRLARDKYPREVRVVEAVPVTSVGKTDRKAVRQLLGS